MGGFFNTAANLGSPFRSSGTQTSTGESFKDILAPHTAAGQKKQSPPPPDYMGAAKLQADAAKDISNSQTQANRPTQYTPYGSSSWSKDANGNWTQVSQLNGPLAGTAQQLTSQAAQSMAQPFDWSQFGQAQTGDQARDQAISGAYGQATSRLDPQWQQRQTQMNTQLINQGIAPGTDAYNRAMNNFGQQRNDAYSSAMNGAIGQGTAAGDSAFRNNMMARQSSISDALRQRNMPLNDLQSLNGMMQMPGFNAAGGSSAPDLLQALGLQTNYNLGQQQLAQGRTGDYMSGLSSLGSMAMLFAML